jgi:hypothetical protein
MVGTAQAASQHHVRQPCQGEIAARGGAGRRSAQTAAARMIDHAKRTARRGRSTTGGQTNGGPTWPVACVARFRMPLPALGSRRAAISGCEGREGAGQTVKEPDRRSVYAGLLTRRFLHLFTVLNSPQFHAEASAQISHGGSQGFKSPHLHPL